MEMDVVRDSANHFDRIVDLQTTPSCSIDLRIRQCSVGDVGVVVWDSALVAVKYFEQVNTVQPRFWAGQRVVELGAGTGVASIALAALGASVVSTDLPSALQLLQTNVHLNNGHFASAQLSVRPLTWGNEEHISQVDIANLDAVVMIDCLYYDQSLEPLHQTLLRLTSHNLRCTIYCVYEVRDVGQPQWVQQKFLEMISDTFDVETVCNHDLHPDYQAADIRVLKLIRKK